VASRFTFDPGSHLKSQAATFDLSKLEQMESASVILDRNGKIFGKSTSRTGDGAVRQLPRDLVNAVVGVETRNFTSTRYDLFGITRAALKNFRAGHVGKARARSRSNSPRNSFSLKEKPSPQVARNFSGTPKSRRASANKKSWSCI